MMHAHMEGAGWRAGVPCLETLCMPARAATQAVIFLDAIIRGVDDAEALRLVSTRRNSAYPHSPANPGASQPAGTQQTQAGGASAMSPSQPSGSAQPHQHVADLTEEGGEEEGEEEEGNDAGHDPGPGPGAASTTTGPRAGVAAGARTSNDTDAGVGAAGGGAVAAGGSPVDAPQGQLPALGSNAGREVGGSVAGNIHTNHVRALEAPLMEAISTLSTGRQQSELGMCDVDLD